MTALSAVVGRSGLHPTLVGIIPYAGLSFCTYHSFKGYYIEKTGLVEDDIPTPIRLGGGAISGLVAQSATYPLDVVRRRMQVQSSSSATGHVYTGVWQAMRLITKDEGVAALYKGLSMNW